MNRTFLFVAILAAQFAAAEMLYSRSPDQVTDSPIPPLKEPVALKMDPKATGQVTTVTQGQSHSKIETPSSITDELGVNLGTSPKPRVKTPPQGEFAQTPSLESPKDGSEYYTMSREELWETPPMREARDYVVDFSQRSAQTSPADGEQFLKDLAALPVEELRSWLVRFRERQLQIIVQQATEDLARQMVTEKAINKQEAMRQASARIAQLRAEASARGAATQRRRARRAINREPDYDRFEPIFDPSTPRGYARWVAAAMSLPGDLPPNDPRNYINTERLIDTSESTVRGDATPPNAALIPRIVPPAARLGTPPPIPGRGR